MTPQRGQFLVYQTQDGKLKIDVRFEGETVWLTQAADGGALPDHEAERQPAHPKRLYGEGSSPDQCQGFLDNCRRRQVNLRDQFYNLDVIISVGYRVKSQRGTQFRMWATQRLREYSSKASFSTTSG